MLCAANDYQLVNTVYHVNSACHPSRVQ